jgi:hypothetical protein
VKRALSEAIQLEGRGRVEILASAAAASIRSGDLSTWKEMLSFEDDFEAEKKTALVASHAAVALMDRGATEEAIELARAHVDAARKAIDLRDANEYRTKPASLSRLGLVFARGGHNDEAKRIAVRLRSEPSSGQKEDAILAETWALLGCAPEAVTELIDIDDPETFRRVLRILVEQNASGRAVTDVVRFWSDAVRGIEHRPTRAIMLAKIALVLDGTELRDHATVEVQRVSSLMTPKPKVSQSALASRQRAMPSGRERFRIRNQPNRSSSPRTDKSSLEPPPSSPPVTSPDAGALDDALLVLLPAGTIGTS